MSKRSKKAAPPPAPERGAGSPGTRFEWWPVESIVPYEHNPKDHPPEQVAALAALIDEHGWTQPLAVRSDGELIAGHGRLLAAQSLGLLSVPVLIRDDVTPEQARQLRIADNRMGELGHWNKEELAGELAALRELDLDVSGLGFTDDELRALEREVARDLAGAQTSAPPAAATPRGPAGEPVLSYGLIFDDEGQQQRWFAFIRQIKVAYPTLPSTAARVDAWIAASTDPTKGS